MWVMTSGEDEKCKGVIFRYSPSRAEKVAKELLSRYLGIIVTDGYVGYNNIENTTHAECWAHARRYFYESIPSGNTNCSGWVYLTSQKYTTNKKLQKALTYAINQKDELCEFIRNAKIPMTNSRAERAIRPLN